MDPIAATLLPRLLQRCHADLDAMRRALGEGRLHVVCELGHRMAGACGTFGQDELEELGRRLERAAGAGDAAAVGPALDDLEAHLQGMHEETPPARGAEAES